MVALRPPRPLSESDCDRVARIEALAFSDPWSRQAFAQLLKLGNVRGFAVDDEAGTVIAYGLCSLNDEQGEVLNLAVEPEARGRGAGSALLGAMLDWLRSQGARAVFLEVRQSNSAAISLYRRSGFAPLGLRRDYYRRPREDALTMSLDLGLKDA